MEEWRPDVVVHDQADDDAPVAAVQAAVRGSRTLGVARSGQQVTLRSLRSMRKRSGKIDVD